MKEAKRNDAPFFPAADAHCDFLYGMIHSGYDLRRPTKRQAIRLDKLKEGGVKLQLFAAWVDMQLDANPLNQVTGMIDAYYRMLSANEELTPLTKEFDPAGDRIAAVLTVEGGEAIEASLHNIAILHRLGVRAMTLTWNDENRLAYPAKGGSRRGLTRLGKEAVREMCRVGVAVDLAHLNDAGIDDVLSIASRPVFASHSNSRFICDNPRCLTDEQIEAISKQGGVVGVNFFSKQLTERRSATITDVVRHIDRVASVGGTKAAAIGSDFDGMGTYIDGLDSSAGLPTIANELLKLNYSEEDVRRIMFDNLYNYILRFC